MANLRGIYILNEDALDMVYGVREQADIARMIDIYAPPQTRGSLSRNPGIANAADVIFSGWGGPLLDDRFLDSAPNLKAVFYGAGSMASILTDAVWKRGIQVTSAIAANGVPVAEYTLAAILFSLKHAFKLARDTRQTRQFQPRDSAPGCYRSTVGIISLGVIARTLLKLLQPFQLRTIVYDPFLSRKEADELGVTRVSLEEIFQFADVVSLHAPLLPETEGMICGTHLASMKAGATFINTARAQLVCQAEMIEIASQRQDLQFVLDVADPEPLPDSSPLFELPNVFLTPHIAGSVGTECQRMGRYMVEDLERFLAGKVMLGTVTAKSAWSSSHRPVGDRNLKRVSELEIRVASFAKNRVADLNAADRQQ